MSIVTPKTNFVTLLEDIIKHLCHDQEQSKVFNASVNDLLARCSRALQELEEL